MTINQISIFLENKYGKLSRILSLLAQEKIRIIAATIADTSEFGILRIVVDDPQKALLLLKKNDISANISDVIAVLVDSESDDFSTALTSFTLAGISIEYMYCFSVKEKSVLILKVNNWDAAHEVIRRENICCLNESELKNL